MLWKQRLERDNMTQFSQPHDGVKANDNTDGGAYTSLNVLPSRQNTLMPSVCGTLRNPFFRGSVIGIDNETRIVTILLERIQFNIGGVTWWADDITIDVDWSSIKDTAKSISIQFAVTTNRTKTTVNGVAPNTAQLVTNVFDGTQYGLYRPGTGDYDVKGVFTMPICTFICIIGQGHTINLSDITFHVHQSNSNYTVFNPMDGITPGVPATPQINKRSWNAAHIDGVLRQSVPRILLGIKNITDIVTYNGGVETASYVHTLSTGRKVVYLMLTNEDFSGNTWELLKYDLVITKNGTISGEVTLYHFGNENVKVEQFTGHFEFDKDLIFEEIAETLYTVQGAEITVRFS